MRHILLLLLLLLLLSPFSLLRAATTPNILLIVADDLGYADLGFQGCKDIPTPHLDALAARSVRFTSGYAGHAYCSPTRAALMTGRYQHRFGHENNPRWEPENDKIGLPVDETLLPQILKTAGYATGLVGKWHLGAHPVFHPQKRGFDEFFGFLGGGHAYLPAAKASPEYTSQIQRDGQPVRETEYLTDALSREAVAFVSRPRAGTPWFLFLAYNAPHTPLQVAEPYASRVKAIADPGRRSYAALVASVDAGVGRVLEAVRKTGAEKDTLVFFFSDNGGPTRANASDNRPLRGEKSDVFEGGIRVPFLVSWPARLKPAEYAQPVFSTDLFATASAAAGASIPGTLRLDGVDFLPFVTGEKKGAPHERLFWRVGGSKGRLAVREGDWKWMRQDDKKYLFNLAQDLGEQRDLSAAEPARAAALEKHALAWSAKMIEPRWPGLNAGKEKKK